jgi:zinc transporter ZupT
MRNTARVLTAGGWHAPVLVMAGAALIALATVAGAWLARRRTDRRELYLGAAAGALLVIAGTHLLPDAWSGAERSGLWPWVTLAVSVASFTIAGFAVRAGCSCQSEREEAGGVGAAVALAVHRLLEGAALALATSAVVAVALGLHALAEGTATGTLLRSASRRRTVLWLTSMCVSPVAGTALTAAWSFPARLAPVLLAVAAGVLAQAARVSLAAAFRLGRDARTTVLSPAAATVAVAVVTLLAVRGAA